jgi:hypothetical protein
LESNKSDAILNDSGSNESADWILSAPEDERLCWSFLLNQDWLATESKWAKTRLIHGDRRARAWALGPLAKLSDLEEFREARMLARMLIWQSAFGRENYENPYAGPQGIAIERMFDEAFIAKAGHARALLMDQHSESQLLPLARALGRTDVDAKGLSRLAKLRSFENMAPESASVSYIGSLAQRALDPEEEELAMKFLSPKIHPGKR